MEKIYIDYKEPIENINQLLTIFYSPQQNPYENHLNGMITFNDENCTKTQCLSYKVRSIDDLFSLTKTYFPEATIKDLIHEIVLFKGILRGKPVQFFPSFCNTIDKLTVYFHESIIQEGHFNSTFNKKLGSKWSWKELFEMLDINSFEDFNNYKNKNK